MAPWTTFAPSTPHRSISSNLPTATLVSKLASVTLPLLGRTATVKHGKPCSSAVTRSSRVVEPDPCALGALENCGEGVERSKGGIWGGPEGGRDGYEASERAQT